MIIHRIASALKRQQWSQVIIEVLIVVSASAGSPVDKIKISPQSVGNAPSSAVIPSNAYGGKPAGLTTEHCVGALAESHAPPTPKIPKLPPLPSYSS